jgi:hypothetical protein
MRVWKFVAAETIDAEMGAVVVDWRVDHRGGRRHSLPHGTA